MALQKIWKTLHLHLVPQNLIPNSNAKKLVWLLSGPSLGESPKGPKAAAFPSNPNSKKWPTQFLLITSDYPPVIFRSGRWTNLVRWFTTQKTGDLPSQKSANWPHSPEVWDWQGDSARNSKEVLERPPNSMEVFDLRSGQVNIWVPKGTEMRNFLWAKHPTSGAKSNRKQYRSAPSLLFLPSCLFFFFCFCFFFFCFCFCFFCFCFFFFWFFFWFFFFWFFLCYFFCFCFCFCFCFLLHSINPTVREFTVVQPWATRPTGRGPSRVWNHPPLFSVKMIHCQVITVITCNSCMFLLGTLLLTIGVVHLPHELSGILKPKVTDPPRALREHGVGLWLLCLTFPRGCKWGWVKKWEILVIHDCANCKRESDD